VVDPFVDGPICRRASLCSASLLRFQNVEELKQEKKEMTDHQVVELRDEERTRCEVWTRVMGYHRPVSAFNAGKRAEHQERQYFVECRSGTAVRIEQAA
jgi:hypothetical protein